VWVWWGEDLPGIDEGCHTAPHPEVNFWLSTYGLPAQQLAALQTSFESLLSGLFEKVSPESWKGLKAWRLEGPAEGSRIFLIADP